LSLNKLFFLKKDLKYAERLDSFSLRKKNKKFIVEKIIKKKKGSGINK
jgi:hypothetical protein